MQPIRQGDVILLPIQTSDIAGKKLPHLILAEGEVSGHTHRISGGKAELREKNETLYLKVISACATLTHQEHQSVQIPQGHWIVRIQRQYEPGGWSFVED